MSKIINGRPIVNGSMENIYFWNVIGTNTISIRSGTWVNSYEKVDGKDKRGTLTGIILSPNLNSRTVQQIPIDRIHSELHECVKDITSQFDMKKYKIEIDND